MIIQVSTSVNACVTFGYVICFSFMFVNERTWTVLNESCVRVHVRGTQKSGNQIWFDWVVESEAPPRSFPGVSKTNLDFKI